MLSLFYQSIKLNTSCEVGRWVFFPPHRMMSLNKREVQPCPTQRGREASKGVGEGDGMGWDGTGRARQT